jgi:thiol-disulfide isomerase/thioredoxin
MYSRHLARSVFRWRQASLEVKFLIVTILLFSSSLALAQSGRVAVPDPTGAATPERSVKELFNEANAYFRTKGAEFDAKKIAATPERIEQVRREQRELAARYAAEAETRRDLSAEDHYYIGMLHWIALNLDGTIDNLTKFVAATDADPERAQKARYTIVVSLAKQHKTEPAEKLLVEYLAKEPVKPSEHWRMDVELAKAYEELKDFTYMLPHAEAAFTAGRKLLGDAQAADLTLDHVVDTGILAFDAYSETGQREKAEGVLDEMRFLGTSKASPSLYYYAVDQKIRYLIETGRKDKALQFYNASMASIASSFPDKSKQNEALQKLKDRQKAYELLGTRAPDFLTQSEVWLSGQQKGLDDLKGKVVMLDFWATWCGPCVEGIPEMKDLHDEFAPQGLAILGLTRYYGESYGLPADRAAELAQVKAFREKHALPWDIVVADGQQVQVLYGAMLLPTTVLIDRKGVVRYVASGTNSQRSAELRHMIERLVAEK